MSIIIVKKEQNKIILAADSQETFGESSKINVLNSKVRSFTGKVYVGASGDAHVSSMFYAYVENFPMFNIKSAFELITYFFKFSTWLDENLKSLPDENNPLSLCQFLIVIKDRVWIFTDYYVRELETGEFFCAGSGSKSAIPCMKLEIPIEKVLSITCQTDLYCSEPVKIYEIPIK